PIAFIPSSASVPVLNADGSQRTQNQIVGGVSTPVPVSMPTPFYQIITPGGDTHAVFNFEYRIPIIGPVQLVPFFDVGKNWILFPNQLSVNPQEVVNLNNQFPSAGFTSKVPIAAGTQATRMSTGLEIDVTLPIVQAPFRVYYAYNPLVVRQNLQPPIVFDP